MSAPRRGDAMLAMERATSAVLVRVPHDGLALIIKTLRAYKPANEDQIVNEVEDLMCSVMADTLERDLPPSMRRK